MLKSKLTSILATAMFLSLGHYAQAYETQDYLVQKAADLCGHDGDITYLEAITEDSSRLAADPDFFALIKKLCGTDTQIKKCLKETFAPSATDPANSETPSEEKSSEELTAASNLQNVEPAKTDKVVVATAPLQTSLSASYGPSTTKTIVVSSSSLQAVSNITAQTTSSKNTKEVKNTSVISSTPVFAAASSQGEVKGKPQGQLPPLTFARPEKSKKKCSQRPRAAAYVQNTSK